MHADILFSCHSNFSFVCIFFLQPNCITHNVIIDTWLRACSSCLNEGTSDTWIVAPKNMFLCLFFLYHLEIWSRNPHEEDEQLYGWDSYDSSSTHSFFPLNFTRLPLLPFCSCVIITCKSIITLTVLLAASSSSSALAQKHLSELWKSCFLWSWEGRSSFTNGSTHLLCLNTFLYSRFWQNLPFVFILLVYFSTLLDLSFLWSSRPFLWINERNTRVSFECDAERASRQPFFSFAF